MGRLDTKIEKLTKEIPVMQDQIKEMSKAPADVTKNKIEQLTKCMMTVRKNEEESNQAIQEQIAQEREHLKKVSAEHLTATMKEKPAEVQKKRTHFVLLVDLHNVEIHEVFELVIKELKRKRS